MTDALAASRPAEILLVEDNEDVVVIEFKGDIDMRKLKEMDCREPVALID